MREVWVVHRCARPGQETWRVKAAEGVAVVVPGTLPPWPARNGASASLSVWAQKEGLGEFSVAFNDVYLVDLGRAWDFAADQGHFASLGHVRCQALTRATAALRVLLGRAEGAPETNLQQIQLRAWRGRQSLLKLAAGACLAASGAVLLLGENPASLLSMRRAAALLAAGLALWTRWRLVVFALAATRGIDRWAGSVEAAARSGYTFVWKRLEDCCYALDGTEGPDAPLGLLITPGGALRKLLPGPFMLLGVLLLAVLALTRASLRLISAVGRGCAAALSKLEAPSAAPPGLVPHSRLVAQSLGTNFLWVSCAQETE